MTFLVETLKVCFSDIITQISHEFFCTYVHLHACICISTCIFVYSDTLGDPIRHCFSL